VALGIFFLLFCHSVSYGQPPASPSIQSSPGSSPSSDDQLKSAILEHQSKLGVLEPWQKVLYSEEVVPEFSRFIRGYQSSPKGGMRVDIDTDSLRNYLVFYGPRSIKKPETMRDFRVSVFLKGDSSCQKCVESQAQLQQIVQLRLERRGLTPVFLSSDELSPQANNQLLFDQLASKSKQKGTLGSVLVSWNLIPVDASDTAHADEKHYSIESFFQAGEFPVLSRQKEILENDSFEVAETRLLTDIFTDLGTKIEFEQINLADQGKEEMIVEVSGIKDFSQYNRVKLALQTHLKDVASLEERKFSKNQVVFAMYSKKSLNELRKQIGQMNLDSGGDQFLTVVVR
jgi:hypothetical protein